MEALEPKEINKNKSKALLDNVIQNVPAENLASTIFSYWTQASDDLEFQFNDMLNLK